LTGAHFADEAFTENADLGTEVGQHSDVLVGIVTAGLHGAWSGIGTVTAGSGRARATIVPVDQVLSGGARRWP
jgi:hypothetical protein